MPTLQPSRRKVLGRWRRRFFATWIGLTIVALAALAALEPLALTGLIDKAAVAAFMPALMIVLTLTGIGWLALVIVSRRDGRRPGRPERTFPR